MNRYGWFGRLLQRIRLRRLRREIRRSTNRMLVRIESTKSWMEDSHSSLLEAVERSKHDFEEAVATLDSLRISVNHLADNQHKYEAELEELRTKLNISERVTIPGMVQSNELLMQQLKANTELEIRKQVATREAS